MSYIYFENKTKEKPNKVIPYSNIISKFVNENDKNPMYLFRIKINTMELINTIDSNNSLINLILAVKFLSFSVIKFECDYYAYQKKIEINNEKSIFFEYKNLYELRELLRNKPLYLILIDKNSKRIICSTNLNIGLFSQDFFLNYDIGEIPPPPYKKEIFFFNNNIPICKSEISILIRREYYEYENHYKQNNLFNLHIPVQSISDKKLLIPSYFLSEKQEEKVNNDEKINFDIELNNKKKKDLNDDNFDIFKKPKFTPQPIYYHHKYKRNPDIFDDKGFSSLINEIKLNIPTNDTLSIDKNEDSNKNNKLYIKIPPRFPEDKIEKNLEEKNPEIINYDELMRKTYQGLYKNK